MSSARPRRAEIEAHRAADQLAAAAEDRDRHLVGRPAAEQLSLARRHAWTSAAVLHRVELLALPQSVAGDRGQRQIHVVAAEQDVIADRDPLERERATVVGDLDQREVGGAAADVAHQHDVAGHQLLAATRRRSRQVRVERGLRLLEQRDLRQPASRAATTVSSRATASNDAGTVTSTS
jgi:hypothetical protein